MKQVKSEIIAVGTELLLGQIANTNAQWLSEQLATYGINTYHHAVVGDNLMRVKETFLQAQNRSNVIIVSGGLGPTDDDLTREAFQLISGMEIIEHAPSMQKVESFFNKQQSKMTPNNRKQARVFKGSQVIENRVGMAPGMIVTYENRTWIFLPGVPREMKQMSIDNVFPYLIKLSGQNMVIKSMTLRFIGIGESKLEHDLQDLIRTQENPTIAPLAQKDGVVIRLTVKENSTERANDLLEETKERILSKVGKYFYGMENETIAECVFGLLKSRNKRISAAESLTGGKFVEKLISIKGASQICPGGIVCYNSSVKENVLHVSPETIHSKGVVSKECAIEMATNVCDVLDTDIGISFTGVAGPGDLEGQQVGTGYIAISSISGECIVEKFAFQGNRDSIRHRATLKGYELLFNFLK